MRLCCTAGLAVAVALSGPVAALDLQLPGVAELTREVDRDADTYFLPVAPFAQGRVPSREIEGRILRQAWRIETDDLTTLSLLGMIRSQLQAQGYTLLLDCTAD
ncbi:MAG: OmpA family protein, partial [Pseudomonadota bacterium]